MTISNRLLLLFLFSLMVTCTFAEKPKGVSYDGRSMIVNGERELLFSGSIHYPRMPPEMWPDVIRKAKEGGLNLIQTYVFWNIHEPVQGQFNFEGNYDVVKFIKEIARQGLYVTLRIGPYIEAEWNQGGFPYWLREVPNITFRSYNEPFIYHMKKYSEMVIDLMKKEQLFAPQGGPIIMAQIENEYNNVQLAYRENGLKYIQWAANMASSLYNGVPWIMCKQRDAPPHIINTCNGRHCGDTFTGPNGPNKPSLWTENWTAQYRTFGDPPSQRAAEDIAFAYYGGTNYGRTGSSFVTTRYYDEAPLDEFGLYREPKWSHLRDLHRALRLSRRALLWGTPTVQKISADLEITVYEKQGTDCTAFLTNNHTTNPATIKFRGKDYYLPEKSVSILPDCKTVVYNTQTIVSQHNSRNFVASEKAKGLKWEKYQEKVPTSSDLPLKNREPLELYSLTKDTSDYAWYSTSVTFERHDLPMRPDILPVLQIASMGHALVAFVNGEYVGFGHGNNIEKGFVFQKPVVLKPGTNTISILAETVGFPNSGAYMEKRFAGPRAITIQGLMAGTLDITQNNWGHEVGVFGEKEKLFTEEGAKKVKWTPVSGPTNGATTWYKTTFDAPEGNNPLAVKMDKMQKGMMWVNGNSLGRYWSSFLSPLGQPTQFEYHIPRAFVKPTGNVLVVFEETGGNPADIEIQTVNRDTICSIITEYHPPNVKSWERSGTNFVAIVEDLKTGAHLTCPDNKIIEKVEFASYGNPDGACGNLAVGTCNSAKSMAVAQEKCLGKNSCTIPIEREIYDEPSKDPCPNIFKTLAVQMKCANKK
ncbi:beta-galactosidase 13-like isoform X2 [Solanum lycopersicum]|uniref:beta-galactosidase 13-like isoform X2 n=1 Tax=Solanum lycopersicum TaxID=4081 RepID=UPI0008FECFD6|nr:beta-galactosidase 13-like isoform X2 [Solanum lycopersicum]